MRLPDGHFKWLIWSGVRMWQYRDGDHWQNTLHFIYLKNLNLTWFQNDDTKKSMFESAFENSESPNAFNLALIW